MCFYLCIQQKLDESVAQIETLNAGISEWTSSYEKSKLEVTELSSRHCELEEAHEALEQQLTSFKLQKEEESKMLEDQLHIKESTINKIVCTWVSDLWFVLLEFLHVWGSIVSFYIVEKYF